MNSYKTQFRNYNKSNAYISNSCDMRYKKREKKSSQWRDKHTGIIVRIFIYECDYREICDGADNKSA